MKENKCFEGMGYWWYFVGLRMVWFIVKCWVIWDIRVGVGSGGGCWDDNGMGIAEIRRTYNTRVVIWPVGLLFFSFCFLCYLWCCVSGVCVLLIMVLIFKHIIKSAVVSWRLGLMRLEVSLCLGDIRKVQVFGFRYIFFSLYFGFSSLQRLEIPYLGQKPVCVVLFGSIWIRGGGCYIWEIAEIRRFYNTWVVIWQLWLLLKALMFYLSWYCDVCVGNLLVLVSTVGTGTKSAVIDWALGMMRLEFSLYMGAIRLGQVFANRYFFSVLCFIFRSIQRLENLDIFQKPVCVVCCIFSWIGFLRIWGVGYVWGTEGIRVLKALRVVILLNPWLISSGYLFLSGLCCSLLGNLNPFFCFVASLFGASTILAASVVFEGVLGFFVLKGCTQLGDIRLEIALAGRTLTSFISVFCQFVVLSKGNQTWSLWKSCFFEGPFIVFNLSQSSRDWGLRGKYYVWFVIGSTLRKNRCGIGVEDGDSYSYVDLVGGWDGVLGILWKFGSWYRIFNVDVVKAVWWIERLFKYKARLGNGKYAERCIRIKERVMVIYASVFWIVCAGKIYAADKMDRSWIWSMRRLKIVFSCVHEAKDWLEAGMKVEIRWLKICCDKGPGLIWVFCEVPC
ncbi:hypothetical protein HanHA300_Chr10g0377421 [Helianthus annuus]|nr:hypothetical protein HanHA300_Chr10g0377421 [Helianthus annuus]KAJ0698165.1 hypothetical protein HanLR1_Chr10g0377121 [Helianthus annuus]KAJ0701532.1 hypothetical protein HanOQP8_Chr10g0380421 [Helianthus annuus]